MLAAMTLSVPLFAAGFASGRIPARLPILPSVTTETVTRTVTVEGRYRGVRAATWARRLQSSKASELKLKKRARDLKRTLLARPSVGEALNLACVVYGNCETLWRRARCESRLDPIARNGSEASGLLQFLPSTWRSTPFARFSVFSPYANALAAGWMIGPAHRGSEWSCR